MKLAVCRPYPGATRFVAVYRINYADFGSCRGIAVRLGPVVVYGFVR